MPDANKIAAVFESGTPEAIARDLWRTIRTKQFNNQTWSLEQDLKLFALCLNAARGMRYDISSLC